MGDVVFHDVDADVPEHEHEWVVLHHYGDNPDGPGLLHYCPTEFVMCNAHGPELEKEPDDTRPGTPVEWACAEWDLHDNHPEIPRCKKWGEP